VFIASIRFAHAVSDLFFRAAHLYWASFRLLVRIPALLIIPSALILILSRFIPNLYTAVLWIQLILLQPIIAAALVTATAQTIRHQPISVTLAYRLCMHRYGIMVAATFLLGGLVLLPFCLLLPSRIDSSTLRSLLSFTLSGGLRLFALVALGLFYIANSFLLTPVAMLEHGGPGWVVMRMCQLSVQHFGFLLIIVIGTTMLTTLITTLPEQLTRWGFALLVYSSGMTPSVGIGWLEWAISIGIQQALLLATMPFQPITSTLWYLDASASKR
jgi:hypothetical protein